MGKSEVGRRRYDYCRGHADVHMGVSLAPKRRQLLYVLTADMCIAPVRMRSVGVDVSIVRQLDLDLRPAIQSCSCCWLPAAARTNALEGSIGLQEPW